MAQAAQHAGLHPRELSFKHTVQLWSVWATTALRTEPGEFFRLIVQLTVGNRPGRVEPRARKRRPKSYPWLKVSRAEARRQIQNEGHLLWAKLSAIGARASVPGIRRNADFRLENEQFERGCVPNSARAG